MPAVQKPALTGRVLARCLWRLGRVYWTSPDWRMGALLHRPARIVLDPATSSLHADMQRQIHELLAARLPKAGLIAVSERAAEGTWQHRWRLVRHGEGPVALEAA